jgi:methylenetetrahydrofolate reductase (NADPH)
VRGNFHDGIFSLMVDYALPSTAKPLLLAMEEGVGIMKRLAKDKRISAVTVGDGVDALPHYPLPSILKALRKASRKLELLVGVSGAGLCENDLAKVLTDLAELRADSILAYVGPKCPEHPANDSGIPLSTPQDYLDSAKMIYQIRRQWPGALVGARVNPFKYCIEDVHLQYYRMIKGISSGAEFLFTQPGWDMKKLHELQWYMRMRELDVPVIAKVGLLQYEGVNAILRNDWPGIALSRELGAVVQRQFADEREGIEHALRRLGLQVAGCRLLGFSGVTICGCDDVLSVELALDHAAAALEEFKDFDTWLDAWDDCRHGVETAPAGSRYYVFRNLMTKGGLDFDDETVELADDVLPDPEPPERMRYRLAKRFASNAIGGPVGDTVKRFLCGYRPGAEWQLDKTAMLCAAGCPKGLEEGVCEESRPDGTCEFGHRPCFFHDVLKLEQWQKRLDNFEAPYED